MNDNTLPEPFKAFARSIQTLFVGPQVTVRVGGEEFGYRVAKSLLCKHSSHFRHYFQHNMDKEDDSLVLPENPGVITNQSVQLLVQWMYFGTIELDEVSNSEAITAIVEFANLAEHYGIGGLEVLLANEVRSLLKPNPDECPATNGGAEVNTRFLTSEHIKAASHLAVGHPLRVLFAEAAVRGFIQIENHKFRRETEEIPSFANDLLKVLSKMVIQSGRV